MDLTPYINRLREDLTAAASAGDEQTRHTAAVLGAALEPAARLTIMNALSDLAAEVTAALRDQVVEVRLDGRDVRVAVTSASESKPAPGPQVPPRPPGAATFAEMGGDISRMTLRLVDQIKGQAERAAAEQGMSLNAWVSQAVQGALRGEGRRGAHPGSHEPRSRNRVHGWVRG